MTVMDLLSTAAVVPCRPWPRHGLSPAQWSAFFTDVASTTLTLRALWADTQQAHALLLDSRTYDVTAVSTPIEDGLYPAVSPHCPVAGPFERMVADLWGHAAAGAGDQRPWLDHGHWPLAYPMAPRPDAPRIVDPLAMLAEPDDGLMQLALGPIHGRLEEAARLSLLVRDGAVAAAEGRLGFTHKGTLILMRGKTPRNAARFAARLSGDATVAHALAFSIATEAALEVQPPPRAVTLRAVMLETERIANHLDNLAEVGRLGGATDVWTRCGRLRERLLRAAATAFGHRLLMDCVVPGGVALDIAAAGPEAILRALGDIATELPGLRRLHIEGFLAARLSGIGPTPRPVLRLCGAGGPVARAAGCSFDARALTPSPQFTAITGRQGDALGRQHQRIEEIAASADMVGLALRTLPDGPLTETLPQASGEGIGCAESVRGDIWHWLRLDHGQIAACFVRDPGWALWPVAETVLVNASADDADLIKASLALPSSGVDL